MVCILLKKSQASTLKSKNLQWQNYNPYLFIYLSYKVLVRNWKISYINNLLNGNFAKLSRCDTAYIET